VQAADEMSGHVERVHHCVPCKSEVCMSSIASRSFDKYTYGLDGHW
jgi:hypothetical protein